MNAGANNAITAGHDLMIDARKDIVIANSNIDAGRNIDLNAENNLTITTDQGAYSEVHDGQSLGGEVGITVFENGSTIGFYGEVSGGQNDLKRLENNYQNSRLNAGDTLSIRTGKDTTIAGANLTADDIKADVGGDLWVSSKQDTGEVSGRKWDGSLRVTVGAGVSVSGSAGYGETEGEKNWVSEQTSIIGRESVTINTENHTQLDGALIANITEEGKDGGQLTLNTGTFAYSDIQDKHTETSNYTRISGSWESENSGQDRGNNSGYTQTTGQNRGSETGSSLDDRTTAGIEGSYSSLDREQINRATVGAGTITIKDNPEQDISSLNRDINTAQQVTKDKERHTELYVTETAVEDLGNLFTPDVEDDPTTPEDETQVNTLTKWGEGLENIAELEQIQQDYQVIKNNLDAWLYTLPEDMKQRVGEGLEAHYKDLIRQGYDKEQLESILKNEQMQAVLESALTLESLFNEKGGKLSQEDVQYAITQAISGTNNKQGEDGLLTIDINGSAELNFKGRVGQNVQALDQALTQLPQEEIQTAFIVTSIVLGGPVKAVAEMGVGEVVDAVAGEQLAALGDKASKEVAGYLFDRDAEHYDREYLNEITRNARSSEKSAGGLTIGILATTISGSAGFKQYLKNKKSGSSQSDTEQQRITEEDINKLKNKDDWTEEQIKAANRKKQSLANAAKEGKLKVNSKHGVTNAERQKVTKKYRDDLKKRIDSMYADNPTARQNALDKLKSSDIDHIIDLQAGGANARYNLKALDASVNQSYGKQLDNIIKSLGKE